MTERRGLAIEMTWGEVTRRVSISDAPDIGDVLVALHNLLRVNMQHGRLDAVGPWLAFAGELDSILVKAGFGPHLTLSDGSMTVGHSSYPAKPTNVTDEAA